LGLDGLLWLGRLQSSHSLEVTECAVASVSSAGELQQPVDRFDRKRSTEPFYPAAVVMAWDARPMETNIDQAAGVIVESGQTGRTRYTPEHKCEVLATFESSSLSVPVFARQCGIKYPTLAAWIRVRKRGDQTTPRGNPSTSTAP